MLNWKNGIRILGMLALSTLVVACGKDKNTAPAAGAPAAGNPTTSSPTSPTVPGTAPPPAIDQAKLQRECDFNRGYVKEVNGTRYCIYLIGYIGSRGMAGLDIYSNNQVLRVGFLGNAMVGDGIKLSSNDAKFFITIDGVDVGVNGPNARFNADREGYVEVKFRKESGWFRADSFWLNYAALYRCEDFHGNRYTCQ